MRIALIGYGRMAREVEQLALDRGHELVARIDPVDKQRTGAEITPHTLALADVCIEFSQPHAVLDNLQKAAALKKSVVVGTTGWYEDLARAKEIVEREGIGLVYAPNFSIGVNLFYRVVGVAAGLFSRFDDYDVSGIEIHHQKKIDSPSGTARRLSEIVLDKFPRKTRVVADSPSRALARDELHFTSLRTGHFPGTHQVIFDSLSDTIELSHIARSRTGFVAGALLAAEWLRGRTGFFSFDEVLEEFLR